MLAFVAPPAIAGFATLYARTRDSQALDPVGRDVELQARPFAAEPTGRRLAVIVAGNHGTEI